MAVSFQTGGYLNGEAGSEFDMTAGSTVQFFAGWVLAHSLSASGGFENRIWEVIEDDDSDGWGLSSDENGSLIVYTFGGNTGTFATPLSADDSWYHIAVLWDQANSTIRVWVDGTEEFSDTAYGDTSSVTSGKIVAGVREDLTQQFWDGDFAEWSFWGEELTAEEVTALAQGLNPQRVRPGSMLAYWPMHGLAAPVPDKTQYSNHLSRTKVDQADHAPVAAWWTTTAEALLSTAITPDPLQHAHTLEAGSPVGGTPDELQHAHTIQDAGLYGGTARPSQLVIESLQGASGQARVTQLTLESLQDVEDTSSPPLRARTSQFLLESLQEMPLFARPSQFILEILRSIDDQPPKGPRGFYFGRSGGNDILKYGLSHQDDP